MKERTQKYLDKLTKIASIAECNIMLNEDVEENKQIVKNVGQQLNAILHLNMNSTNYKCCSEILSKAINLLY